MSQRLHNPEEKKRKGMSKLGKKARKFAKKNLQSVFKRKRKTKALFKKKFSKDEQNYVEQEDNAPGLSNGRLLQEFVERNGNGLEVVYSLSGWLKNNPSAYHIRLVSKHKLAGRTSFAPIIEMAMTIVEQSGGQ